MIPNESKTLNAIVIDWEERRLDATLFQTPDGLIAAFVELPAGCSLQSFAAARVNTRIREAALRTSGKAPDFYQLRYRYEDED